MRFTKTDYFRRLFSVEEIENSKTLQILYWILLFGFYLSFQDWISSPAVTLSALKHGHYICLPYFQNCGRLYFFDGWPDSYGQAIFYGVLTAFLTGSAFAAIQRRWTWALALMIPAFVWK